MVVYPGGGTGRHAGLKILSSAMKVTVQFRSRVLRSRLIISEAVFFYFTIIDNFYCMYFLYILYSKNYDRYYVGHCEDVIIRLTRHNNRGVPSTKPYVPWELVYTENFVSRSSASLGEREIKNKKSRKYIEFLISQK